MLKELFDDFIIAPYFDRGTITEYFWEHESSSGVYAIFGKNDLCLYVGATSDVRKRLYYHCNKSYRSKLNGRHKEVSMIGIKYGNEHELFDVEGRYIKLLNPSINVRKNKTNT